MPDSDWFEEYEREALRSGDVDRLCLATLHRQAYRFRESDPDHALELLAEGRRLAERLQEPWWVLYYRQYEVHALLHFRQDYRHVLDRAMATALDLRRPVYAGYPRRLMIHGDLVSAYLGIDPAGHAGAIRQALDYLDAEAPAGGDDRYLLLGAQTQFALDLGQLDLADRYSRQSLALAADDPDAGRARHFLVFSYAARCAIAERQGDTRLLEQAAGAGEEMARQVGHQVELAGFRLWRALLVRRQGDEAQAGRLYRLAAARLRHLRMPPDSTCRDAECAFHEAAGDLEQALAVREQERGQIRERGRLAYECECEIKRCWLLRRLGRLGADDRAAARAAARRLRLPAAPLARIDRLEQGEVP